MFYNDKWFKLGWLYLLLLYPLEMFLPSWTGNENGLIENLQMLWLLGGFAYAFNKRLKSNLPPRMALWNAGIIYFFLLGMREISWGRAILQHADGRAYTYSDMGIFGQLVHPFIVVLIIAMLYFIYKGRLLELLYKLKVPAKSFVLLLLFIFASWVAERKGWLGFRGEVAEELSEFGAYMMMFCLMRYVGNRLK